MQQTEILRLLSETKKKALALYSHYHVAAILVAKDGTLFSGINIESSSYGLTICAERVALFKALSEGYREFEKIYIMSDDESPCPPCGACRQVLMDFAPDLQVIMVGATGKIQEVPLKQLLPLAFGPSNLSKRK